MMNDKVQLPSTADTALQATTAYRCSQMPEFAWLKLHPTLRTEILQRHQGSSHRMQAQIKDATALVELHVFQRMNYRGDGHAFLNRLQHKGYAREQIAQALAKAWLSEQDEFELPRRSHWLLVHNLWVQVLFSLAVSIGLLEVVLTLLRHSHPTLAMYLLAFPPLLGIAGFGLLFPILWLVKWGLRQRRPQGVGGVA